MGIWFGSVKYCMKMIRELPALRICFADGGQVGNQFAAQIGYKKERCYYETRNDSNIKKTL